MQDTISKYLIPGINVILMGPADMRKGAAMQPLAAKFCDGLGKFYTCITELSLKHFLKWKYYGTFTYITQIIHSNAHLNL